MATSFSKLVDNLTDNIHNDKCIKCKSINYIINFVMMILINLLCYYEKVFTHMNI